MSIQDMKVDNGASGTKIVKMEYPSNTHKERAPEKREKKVEKIIRGSVVQRKKPLGRRITEAFVGEDVSSVSGYIIHDVLIPAAKSTLSDMVGGGIEMLLFGEARGRGGRRDRNKSYVSYDRVSYKNDNRDSKGRRDISARNRSRHNFDEIILDSRGEAEDVLTHLVDLIDEYKMASVSDLYALVDITPNYTDDKYGWTNLSTATVSRVRDGYLLDLPQPKPLD